jgi:hypothetical protein
LGILARAFVEHGVISEVLLVRHPHYENHPEWYPRAYNRKTVDLFLGNIDILLLFENAFYWEVVKQARARHIPVVMMPMYEYTPWPCPQEIDLFLCPSLLDYEKYVDKNAVFIPVPVEVPWRLRKRAHRFVHNAGHGGKGFRNGTPELLEAMRHVRSPIHLTVRGQPGEKRIKELFDYWKPKVDCRVALVYGDVPDTELWEEGDVFIFPERFNGLSLPLQEAYASGMLVMATDRFPMNTWLPNEPLIPVNRYDKEQIAIEVEKAVIEPQAIAEEIDAWYDQDITPYSLRGKQWAEVNSWPALLPQYISTLEQLL